VNHLAYFILTLSLKPALGKGSRVVNTASHLHRSTKFEADLKKGKHFGLLHGFDNYNRSKLYNVLFTLHLARIWAPEGIKVTCHHPGLIKSGLINGQFGIFEPLIWLLVQIFGRSADAGGQVITWLSTSHDVENISGAYYTRFKLQEPSADARSKANQELLWEQSLRWSNMRDE
jgi:NAD(P)-dependent dehydrogenase (short-subunit alcohol dehydrogenase family)